MPDYHERDEFDIEKGLFLDVEDFSEHLLAPLMAPVVTSLIFKSERHLITDPIEITTSEFLSNHDVLGSRLLDFNETVQKYLYIPIQNMLFKALELHPRADIDYDIGQLLLASSE